MFCDSRGNGTVIELDFDVVFISQTAMFQTGLDIGVVLEDDPAAGIMNVREKIPHS